MSAVPNSTSNAQAWARIRERFHAYWMTAPDVEITIISFDRDASISTEQTQSLFSAVEQWAEPQHQEFVKTGGVVRQSRKLGFQHAQSGRTCERLCYCQVREDIEEFLGCVDDAARLLLQLPARATDFLWKDGFVPGQTANSLLVFWADAVLQLALREIRGNPISGSAVCFTWDEKGLRKPHRARRIAVWNEYLAGEMTREQAKRSSMKLPEPFWFWIAELKGFVEKSLHAIDWILSTFEDDSEEPADPDFQGEMQRFADILAECNDSMTKLLLMAQLVGRSAGKSITQVNAQFFSEHGSAIDPSPDRRKELFEMMTLAAKSKMDRFDAAIKLRHRSVPLASTAR